LHSATRKQTSDPQTKMVKTTDISADEIFHRTAGHTLVDHKRNAEILESPKAKPADSKPRRYKPNLLRHVTGMSSSRMANGMLNCRPTGRRRRLGRPLKGQSYEAETGLSRVNW